MGNKKTKTKRQNWAHNVHIITYFFSVYELLDTKTDQLEVINSLNYYHNMSLACSGHILTGSIIPPSSLSYVLRDYMSLQKGWKLEISSFIGYFTSFLSVIFIFSHSTISQVIHIGILTTKKSICAQRESKAMREHNVLWSVTTV